MVQIQRSVVVTAMFSAISLMAWSQQTPVVQAACGPSATKYEAHKGEQQSGMVADESHARVYFFSELRYGGNTIGCQVVTRIGVDGKWLGANCGTSYLTAILPAGQHHLCADLQSGVLLRTAPLPALHSFVAEAGKTYYFRARAFEEPGILSLDLEPIDADEGMLLLSSSPASTSKLKK